MLLGFAYLFNVVPPNAYEFTTKPQVALQQLLDEDAPKHCVLADAG